MDMESEATEIGSGRTRWPKFERCDRDKANEVEHTIIYNITYNIKTEN